MNLNIHQGNDSIPKCACCGRPISPYVYPGMYPEKLIKILQTVCDVTGVDIKDMRSKSRKTHLVAARQLYCWFACKTSEYSLSKIGAVINYSHCDVIYARKKINGFLEIRDSELMPIFNQVSQLIEI